MGGGEEEGRRRGKEGEEREGGKNKGREKKEGGEESEGGRREGKEQTEKEEMKREGEGRRKKLIVWQSKSHHSPLIILRDIACIVSDSELFVSFELLVLGVDLSTGVVVVTFELFIHCMEEVLDNRRKNSYCFHIKVSASILSLPLSLSPSFHSLLLPPSSFFTLSSPSPTPSPLLPSSLPLSLTLSVTVPTRKQASSSRAMMPV